MSQPERKKQLWLTVGLVVVVLLAAAVFTLGSLNVPLVHPEQGNGFVILFAVTIFVVTALFVFTLILLRTLVRTWSERRAGQMGSRFKVKMVLGAMGVSLLPVVFLFFFSYALVNRTLGTWFPKPLEIANQEYQLLLTDFGNAEFRRLSALAAEAASQGMPNESFLALSRAADASWILDAQGNVISGMDFPKGWQFGPSGTGTSMTPHLVRTIRSGAEVWKAGDQLYIGGKSAFNGGALYATRHLPPDFLDHYGQIDTQTQIYEQQKKQLHTYKREILLALSLITLLLLSTTTWVALYLSKQVTVPLPRLRVPSGCARLARTRPELSPPQYSHAPLRPRRRATPHPWECFPGSLPSASADARAPRWLVPGFA